MPYKDKDGYKKWAAKNKKKLQEYNKEYSEKKREANRERSRKWYENTKHLPCVYYLPEEHYIGVTSTFRTRMNRHSSAGKIVDGAEILCYFEREIDAHYLETLFHMRNYNGFKKL